MPATALYYQKLKPGSCKVDLRFQRPADPARAQRMADNYDPTAVGQLTAWKRDGDYFIIDGQHRDLAAALADPDSPLDFKILEGITLAEAAKMFRLLNDAVKQRPLKAFLVSLTEGNEYALTVDKIINKDNGIPYTPEGFMAVSTAVKIVQRKNGDELLRWAIEVSLRSWGRRAGTLNGQFIEGLATVRAHYGFAVETESMIKKLSGHAGGVDAILGDARTYQRTRGGSMATNIADAIVVVYNKHRHAGKGALSEWKR